VAPVVVGVTVVGDAVLVGTAVVVAAGVVVTGATVPVPPLHPEATNNTSATACFLTT
ncbi:uncharacterized protein METZ01_LOCUS232141, partial [marine metagenome]